LAAPAPVVVRGDLPSRGVVEPENGIVGARIVASDLEDERARNGDAERVVDVRVVARILGQARREDSSNRETDLDGTGRRYRSEVGGPSALAADEERDRDADDGEKHDDAYD
jgi:hypothetical protein